jgi:hypothetical protein
MTHPESTRPAMSLQSWALLAVLAVLTIATRADHFAWFVPLRDASLAAFFLAGLGIARPGVFAALLALAFGVDFVEFTRAGVLADCYTPAYLFLVPTYACLWVAGVRTRAALTAAGAPSTGVWLGGAARLVVASALAFVISNLSYFAWSGQFAHLTLFDYVAATARYALPYVAHAVGYAAAGALLFRLATAVGARATRAG